MTKINILLVLISILQFGFLMNFEEKCEVISTRGWGTPYKAICRIDSKPVTFIKQ